MIGGKGERLSRDCGGLVGREGSGRWGVRCRRVSRGERVEVGFVVDWEVVVEGVD